MYSEPSSSDVKHQMGLMIFMYLTYIKDDKREDNNKQHDFDFTNTRLPTQTVAN
jgi:hypothetical protein